jgi:hypothetical protein
MFFFEKKAPRPGNQKTPVPLRVAVAAPQPREAAKSFFASFFSKKEGLAFS